MSETQQLYSGYPDNFEEVRRDRASEVLCTLEDGIAELRRLNAESARAARQGQPRIPTAQLVAYAQIVDSSQGSARRVPQRWPADAFGPATASR